MEISATRLDRIVTHVEDVFIEFDVVDLNNNLGIPNVGHNIYTSTKALSFVDFSYNVGVRNICRCRNLTSDICTFPFRSQLLPLQV